jgi:transcriptional regulator with XRE-family HTH domain
VTVAVRERLEQLARDRGISLSELSRLIGRNVAYLQQFVQRSTPRQLSEKDRGILAAALGVPEVELGGPAPKAAAMIDIEDPDLIDEVAAAMWYTHDDALDWEKAMHWQDAFRRNAHAALRHLRAKGHI